MKPHIPESKEYLFTKLTNFYLSKIQKKYIEMNDIGYLGKMDIL